jgi:hypothetical protein
MSEQRYFIGVADDDDLGMLFVHNPRKHYSDDQQIELFALDEYDVRKKYDTVLEIKKEEFEGMLRLKESEVSDEVYSQNLLQLIRFGQVRAQREALLKKYGWVMDQVYASDGLHANHHTHGVLESFGHPDLQVTLNIDPKDVHAIVKDMVNDIKKGKKFEDGQRYNEVITNYPVVIRKFTEGDREVHRVIMPDPSGKFPDEDGCDPAYASQGDDFEFIGKFEINGKPVRRTKRK